MGDTKKNDGKPKVWEESRRREASGGPHARAAEGLEGLDGGNVWAWLGKLMRRGRYPGWGLELSD